MKKYIHYGSNAFDRNKFCPIKNNSWGYCKPSRESGLWASNISSKFGWKQWCLQENFFVDKLKENFTFYIKDDAKILHINSINDLEKLPKLDSIFQNTWYVPDFEKAQKQYDAIELHLSTEKKVDNERNLYYMLYGWDCDSILIMNPDIIKTTGDENAYVKKL